MRPFHPPGKVTELAYSGYTPEQRIKQKILSDIAYAGAYGMERTRLPTPGVTLPEEVVEARMQQVAEGWSYESKRDKGSTGLKPTVDLSPLAQQYLTERLLPYPQTDTPWKPRIVVPQPQE